MMPCKRYKKAMLWKGYLMYYLMVINSFLMVCNLYYFEKKYVQQWNISMSLIWFSKSSACFLPFTLGAPQIPMIHPVYLAAFFSVSPWTSNWRFYILTVVDWTGRVISAERSSWCSRIIWLWAKSYVFTMMCIGAHCWHGLILKRTNDSNYYLIIIINFRYNKL